MKYFKYFAYTSVFILCIAAIIIGQKNIGWFGLSLMSVGIAGLLVLLYFYNRSYK